MTPATAWAAKSPEGEIVITTMVPVSSKGVVKACLVTALGDSNLTYEDAFARLLSAGWSVVRVEIREIG